MNKVELLAPAGNEEAFYAAINNGADAIYLGLNDFNARIKAANFTTNNIRQITHYAHLFNVKVYVTVNTIIKNNELNEFIKVIDACIEAKVDAFIIQDFGVAYLLHTQYKDVVMHASTQLGIHNLAGALMAKKLGFTRVILSRETTLEDIKDIRNNTDLEIEYFVQGALCVSFSGNCYMSSMISGLSGNRGKCQQYCRKKYLAIDNNKDISKEYHLSTRDLCLINNLRELVDAGVCSFKIEGRLRHVGYVATVTNAYRKIIYNNFSSASNDDLTKLKVAFSRGDFNYHAYLMNNKDGIINSKNQNHIGVRIGTLKSFRPFKNDLYELEIESSHEINQGDGLKFLNGDNEVMSLGVGNVIKKPHNIYKVFTKNKPNFSKLDVYLTLDARSEEALLENKKRLKINAIIKCKINKPLCLILEYKGLKVRTFSDSILEKANNQPITKEDIIKQINKTKDSPFDIIDFDIENDDVFIAKSVLNDVRRRALEKLEEAIVDNYEKTLLAEKLVDNEENYIKPFLPIKNALIVDENVNYLAIDSSYDGLVIISPSDFKNINPLLTKVKEHFVNASFGINLPIIAPKIDYNYLNDFILKLDNNIYLIANNIYALSYALTHKVIAGLGLNINNNFAIKSMQNLGVSNIILSLETNVNFAKLHEDTFIYALGYNTLMNFTHCPFIHLYGGNCSNCHYSNNLTYKDEFNKQFKIRRIRLCSCHFELINYRPINVYNKTNNQEIYDLRVFKDINFINDIIKGKSLINLPNEYTGLLFKSID